MKKNFLFAAIALAAMSSCSKDEVVDVNNGNAIAFRASLDKAISRSNVTLLSNLNAFNVTAIGNDKNYFTNLAVTSSDGQNWSTALTYYWPSFNLSFFAYAPQNAAGGTVSITNEEKKITSFSPNKTVAEQKDLLIAYNTGNRASNENLGVALNFKHALSQIEVKAKCLNSNIKVEVLGVRVVNAATTADFTFPEDGATTSETLLPQNKWSNRSGNEVPGNAYTIKGSKPIELTEEAQSLMFGDNNFLLIPQKLTAWTNDTEKTGAYLSVMCRIYNVDGGSKLLLYPLATSSDEKTDKYGLSAVAINADWLPGKKYTYTLTFCGSDSGAGRIDPNPDTTDPTIDLTPVPEGKGGDLILGKPIKFTVTVDNWSEESVEMNMN